MSAALPSMLRLFRKGALDIHLRFETCGRGRQPGGFEKAIGMRLPLTGFMGMMNSYADPAAQRQLYGKLINAKWVLGLRL
jgi:hypothetical protein